MADWIDVSAYYSVSRQLTPLEYYQCHPDATRPPGGPGIMANAGIAAMHYTEFGTGDPKDVSLFYSAASTVDDAPGYLTLAGGQWGLGGTEAFAESLSVPGDAAWPPPSVGGSPTSGDTTYDGVLVPLLCAASSPDGLIFSKMRITYREPTGAQSTDAQFQVFAPETANQSAICSNALAPDVTQTTPILNVHGSDLVVELDYGFDMSLLGPILAMAYATDTLDFTTYPQLGTKQYWLPIRKIEVWGEMPDPSNFWTNFVGATEATHLRKQALQTVVPGTPGSLGQPHTHECPPQQPPGSPGGGDSGNTPPDSGGGGGGQPPIYCTTCPGGAGNPQPHEVCAPIGLPIHCS